MQGWTYLILLRRYESAAHFGLWCPGELLGVHEGELSPVHTYTFWKSSKYIDTYYFFSFLELLLSSLGKKNLLLRKMVHIWFFKQNSFFRLEWLQPVPRNTAFGYKERKINQNTHERKRTLKSNIYIDWETLSSFIASRFLTSHDSKDMGILAINSFLLFFLSKYLFSTKYFFDEYYRPRIWVSMEFHFKVCTICVGLPCWLQPIQH